MSGLSTLGWAWAGFRRHVSRNGYKAGALNRVEG